MPPGHLIPSPVPPGRWPEVGALLARAMYPDPERIVRQLAAYHTPDGPPVFVWVALGHVVSAAGLRVDGDRAELLHLGTHPEHTGRGYARTLLLAVAAHLALTTLTALTDDDAVNFYRRAGFDVQPAASHGGRARYTCTLIRARQCRMPSTQRAGLDAE